MQQTEKNNYRSIIKSSAIFGGTQAFNILVNLFRGKLIAVFLGPTGMGISALLSNTSSTLQQVSSLGIHMTAVKDIAEEKERGTRESLIKVISSFRLLLILLGLSGALICYIFAAQLGNLAFHNFNHTVQFKFLSVFVFLSTLGAGELSILQGQRKLKLLAFGDISGSILGLLVGVPFYYYLGIDGIVPAMISLALFNFLVYAILNRDTISVKNNSLSQSEFYKSSKKMISLGSVLMVASLLGSLAIYLLNIYITKTGSIEDVGLFQSANSITNQYVGIVFTAMSVDYFPRLAAISHLKKEVNELVNQQFEIVILIVAPIVCIMILVAPLVVKLLLTAKFLAVVPLLSTMALGVFFKAAAFPLGYISFAKGDRKMFFWMEGVLSNILLLGLNVLAFKYFGLTGLSFSFLIIFFVYFLIVYLAVYLRYDFLFERDCIILMASLFILVLASYFSTRYIENVYIKYSVVSILIVLVSIFSLKELNKRLNFTDMIKARFRKNE